MYLIHSKEDFSEAFCKFFFLPSWLNYLFVELLELLELQKIETLNVFALTSISARPHFRHHFREWTRWWDQKKLFTPDFSEAINVTLSLLKGSWMENERPIRKRCFHCWLPLVYPVLLWKWKCFITSFFFCKRFLL